MAVENKYVNADVVAGIDTKAVEFSGQALKVVVATFEVAAADDNGSIYRVARVNSNLIPIDFTVTNDAITGGTDYDIGIYETLDGPQEGSVKDADKLADGLDLSSGRAEGSGTSGLVTVGVDEVQEPLYLLAGDTAADHPAQYDIAFTANTVGTAAGTVSIKMLFAQG